MLDDRCLDAAALGQHTHAAVVACHQRTLGGGHGDVKVAARMLTEDAHRTRQPERHLRDAGEVLDVARQQIWREGILGHMLELAAGSLFQKRAPLCSGLPRVIVALDARNRRACGEVGRHRVLA